LLKLPAKNQDSTFKILKGKKKGKVGVKNQEIRSGVQLRVKGKSFRMVSNGVEGWEETDTRELISFPLFLQT